MIFQFTKNFLYIKFFFGMLNNEILISENIETNFKSYTKYDHTLS